MHLLLGTVASLLFVTSAQVLQQTQSDFDPTQPQPPPIHTVIPMSPQLRPQHVFSLHSNNTRFSFEIHKEFGDEPNLFLSVVIERIYCFGTDNHLVMEGKGANGQVTRSLKLCMILDNQGWQTVDNILDGVTFAEVHTEGDWASWALSAQLVVSIYREVDHTCASCALGEFCCGKPDLSSKVRCIPEPGVCNHHPNCGLYSNPDEAQSTCSPEGCLGSDCYFAEVALRIAVLVVFCCLIPPTIILITYRFPACRRIWQSCNQVVESWCGRPSPHRPTPSRMDYVVTRSPDFRRDDEPPSYEEFMSSRQNLAVIQLKEPPPSFDEAVGNPGGIWNHGFRHQDEVG